MGNFCCNIILSKSNTKDEHHLDIEKVKIYSKYHASLLETVKEDPYENSELSETLKNLPPLTSN